MQNPNNNNNSNKITTLTKNLPIIWKPTTAPTTTPTPDDYETARCRVFNEKRPARYPTAIIKPTKLEHITTAVNLARELNTRIAIRSGGHSWACWSIRNDSILIDFVDFKFLEYDVETDTLQASPSTMSCEVNAFLKDKGRMTPVGHCGEVGIGGFLLQGGMGLNCRGYGWACEYVKAIDVITADGSFKHCDSKENPDLFWASRGAGPGFPAIVTRFYMSTRPMSTVYMKSMYAWPITMYDEVMPWLVKVTPEIDKDVESLIVSTCIPGIPHRLLIILSTAFATSEADARAKFSPLIDGHPTGTVISQDCLPTSFKEEYEFQDKVNPKGLRYLADDVYIDDNVDMVSACRNAFTSFAGEQYFTYWEPLCPLSKRPLPDMALSMQTGNYVGVYALYENPEEDAIAADWLRMSMHELEKHSAGAYLGDADFQERCTKFWSDDAGKRLMALRRIWDPHGRICGYLDEGDKSGAQGLSNVLSK